MSGSKKPTPTLAKQSAKSPETNGHDNGQVALSFDIESMTMGDFELLEEATGQPFSELIETFQKKQFTAKVLKGIVWLQLRKQDPQATLEDAGNVKLTALLGSDALPPVGDAANQK